MALVRSQIVTKVSGVGPADWGTNNVWHTIDTSGVNPPADYQNHANQIRDLFAGLNTTTGSSFKVYNKRALLIKVYDDADPPHAPPRAQATYSGTGDSISISMPPQVACVLSYYADINLPSQRGRIYVGPFMATLLGATQATYTVPTVTQNQILDLGHGLFDIGGENVAHVVHSRKTATNHVVTDYFVDNRWDTIRSRLQKSSGRVTLHP